MLYTPSAFVPCVDTVAAHNINAQLNARAMAKQHGNLVLAEDANGNRRYMGAVELRHQSIVNGRPEWVAVENLPKVKMPKPVEAAKQKANQDAPPPPPPPPAETYVKVGEVIEKLKLTTTADKARALVGDDQRPGVLKALDKHLQTLEK